MKVFLTGISGFLGSHVAELLTSQGHEVFALVRKTSKLDHLKFPFTRVEGELPHLGDLNSVLSQMDAVIHIAGKVKALSKKEFYETNALGTHQLADACLQAKPCPKLFIYVSSIAVVNPQVDGKDFCIPAKACHPISWYGQSKLEGEKAVQLLENSTRIITLRPPVLYGPRDEELFTLFKSIQHGFAPLYGKGKNQLSICYVKDVASCIADLLEHPPAQDEIYCIDDGSIQTWRSLAQNIADSLSKKVRLLPIPSFLFPVGAFFTELYAKISSKPQIFTKNKIKEMKQDFWVCGFEKLKSRNWKPQMNLTEGAKLTYKFYKENNWL